VEARFEVEGADLAAAVLREHGVPEPDVDRVWEAIALHTSPGIAARRGLLSYLTREGVGIDFGRRPRAARCPAAAPPYSIGGELLRERQANGITGMELSAASSPWGE
jgi:hypothetical protein